MENKWNRHNRPILNVEVFEVWKIRNGLTNLDCSKLCGLSPQAISNAKSGNRLSYTSASAFMNLMNAHFDDIFLNPLKVYNKRTTTIKKGEK